MKGKPVFHKSAICQGPGFPQMLASFERVNATQSERSCEVNGPDSFESRFGVFSADQT